MGPRVSRWPPVLKRNASICNRYAHSLPPSFQEARRNVHRDSYVEVAHAFYEVPTKLIGRQVWVRWDSRCVRIFNERMEQIRKSIPKSRPGQFSHVLRCQRLARPGLELLPLLDQSGRGSWRAMRPMG